MWDFVASTRDGGTFQKLGAGAGAAAARLALGLADSFCSNFTAGGARRGAKSAGI